MAHSFQGRDAHEKRAMVFGLLHSRPDPGGYGRVAPVQEKQPGIPHGTKDVLELFAAAPERRAGRRWGKRGKYPDRMSAWLSRIRGAYGPVIPVKHNNHFRQNGSAFFQLNGNLNFDFRLGVQAFPLQRLPCLDCQETTRGQMPKAQAVAL